MESIKEWISRTPQSDSGDDFGSGDGSGSGFNSGGSDGDGFYGDGFYDYGDGSGDGDGYKDISSLNGEQIYYIDDIPTVITNVKRNLAKGYVVNLNDFSRTACYVARGEGYYAHGETVEEARSSLMSKIFENRSEEERIDEFVNHFPKGKKAKGTEYYEWHHILTGSCKMGRDEFVKSRGLSLEAEYTPEEFIKITENAYGSEVIKELKKRY